MNAGQGIPFHLNVSFEGHASKPKTQLNFSLYSANIFYLTVSGTDSSSIPEFLF